MDTYLFYTFSHFNRPFLYNNETYIKTKLKICFGCSAKISCSEIHKKIVFRTRDANSSINIMKLTSCWIDNQTRPTAFHSQISSFTSSIIKTEEEKVRLS
jgi:hypothetical protein